ncbi:hypothetical protein KMI_01g01360 [Encephalitozoon hellem]|nr:hypothetical protein KMI_01g01360 [Encephalitozoon hellem]
MGQGKESMDEIFIGRPSKREIEMYLLNKEYSLLNNIKLRKDILSSRKTFSRNKVELKPEFIGERRSCENDLGDAVNGTNERRKASIGYRIRSGRVVLTEKDSNSKAKKKKDMKVKKITERNTIRNSGYRYITLVFDGNNESPKPVDKRHRRRVRFSDSVHLSVHNSGEPSSILLPETKPRKLPKIQRKERVFVESLALSTEVESEESE